MLNASITDEKLIAAIGNDDYTSYNKLFVRYYSRLCCYVYRLLGEKEDAEDVVQDLFFTLWNNRKKIAIGENVSGYLYKMARNLALNHIRTQTNYKTVLENREEQLSYYEENPLETEEFRMALYDCINLLPGRCKEVLLLHRVKGLKQKEIADQLSISVKTIKNQIWASLQRLKKCLEVKGI
ncbi:RNA polymerase sigma-70 factor [Parabacteroides sp. TM07-1AC]|uniref:RNA polymerase sigma factor n=1 Tax=Parabacteroides sp. TaxID=1869337 RepID=UPI000F007265|nr:RNA polymerase sigma-70 factor [Parabacteroides sp. TM07-1AC]RHU25615.1 RNA polymerase sigma-70 factor [Parabacteroides sp. TM07-1AC]